MIKSEKLEKDAALTVSQLMAAAVRTAPKTCGIDNIELFIIDDDETKSELIKNMCSISKAEKRPSLERDSNSIATSSAVVVIGVRSNPAGLNCGYCGYGTCEKLSKTPGICAYNSIDLGIAVGSAVSVASDCRIDNRVMYSIGRACLAMGLFSKDVKQALGIPLSVTGKNPFFDRK